MRHHQNSQKKETFLPIIYGLYGLSFSWCLITTKMEQPLGSLGNLGNLGNLLSSPCRSSRSLQQWHHAWVCRSPTAARGWWFLHDGVPPLGDGVSLGVTIAANWTSFMEIHTGNPLPFSTRLPEIAQGPANGHKRSASPEIPWECANAVAVLC